MNENSCISQRNKRSLIVNQNHYLYNMNIPSQRGKSEHLGDKSEKELNKEFIALQK